MANTIERAMVLGTDDPRTKQMQELALAMNDAIPEGTQDVGIVVGALGMLLENGFLLAPEGEALPTFDEWVAKMRSQLEKRLKKGTSN